MGDAIDLGGFDDAMVGPWLEDGDESAWLVFWMPLRMASVRALGRWCRHRAHHSWRSSGAAITGAGSYSEADARSTFGPSCRVTLEGAATIMPVKPSWPMALSQGAEAYLAFRASKALPARDPNGTWRQPRRLLKLDGVLDVGGTEAGGLEILDDFLTVFVRAPSAMHRHHTKSTDSSEAASGATQPPWLKPMRPMATLGPTIRAIIVNRRQHVRGAQMEVGGGLASEPPVPRLSRMNTPTPRKGSSYCQ
jgi:hypothetical protein